MTGDSELDIAALRISYDQGTLAEGDLAPDPLAMFRRWITQARDSGIVEPNAMVLATVDASGMPSARTVLLKGVDARGFSFFSHRISRKGQALSERPVAAGVFGWYALHRQATVHGEVREIASSEVADYFASRPRESQLGAWASAQSSVIPGRAELEASFLHAQRRFGDGPIPVPPTWTGWLIEPRTIEFWQGRPSRLHDRLRYRAQRTPAALDDPRDWVVERLAP